MPSFTRILTFRCALTLTLLCIAVLGGSAQVKILPAHPPERLDPVIADQLKVRIHYGVPLHLHADVLLELGLEIVEALLPYELSLTYQRSQTVVEDSKVNNINGVVLNLESAIEAEEPLLRSYVVRYSSSHLEPERMSAKLRAQCSLVEIVEPYYVPSLCAVPNDSLAGAQEMLKTIQVFDAWDVQPGSATILIGISDSGVLQEHEDLAGALYINGDEIPNNGIDDDGNGYADDYNGYNFCTAEDGTPPGNTYNSREGHGTGVAGICGAVTNNGIGVAGVAGKSRLVGLKTMPNNSSGIIYGYQSIVYCALNNIQVVNCSWGSMSKSCIDESVIRYALERNVAVVAASGNHGTSVPFYPCAYPGVFGVGVTDPGDRVIAMSGTGPTVDIMAPGQYTRTTSNDGTYGAFCCTSGASPIAAGVVALVRAQYPTLTALQACALVRESATMSPWMEIPASQDSLLLPPGRLNALQAVTFHPDSVSSLEYDTVIVTATNGEARWKLGDTVEIEVRMTNILAPMFAFNVQDFQLTSVATMGIALLSANAIPINQTIGTNQQLVIEGIRAVITQSTDTTTYVIANLTGRVESTGKPLTKRLQIPVIPAPGFTNIGNEVVRLSIGDRGRIGNTDIERGQGIGFNYKTWCGLLYEGGLMVGSENKVVDAVRGVRATNDHFRPYKAFVAPNPLTGICRDDAAPDSLKLGVEVTVKFQLGGKDTAIVVAEVGVKNVSDRMISDVGVAYFFDWDIGVVSGSNLTTLDTSIPRYTIQTATSTTDTEPKVLCAVWSDYSDATPISAGLDNTTTYSGFPIEDKIKYLTSGTSSQYTSANDISVVSGMRFTKGLVPGETRSFKLAIVVDSTLEMAKSALVNYVPPPPAAGSKRLGAVQPTPTEGNAVVVPVYGTIGVGAVLFVYDMQGRLVASQPVAESKSGYVLIPLTTQMLTSGTYNVVLIDNVVRSTSLVVVN